MDLDLPLSQRKGKRVVKPSMYTPIFQEFF